MYTSKCTSGYVFIYMCMYMYVYFLMYVRIRMYSSM